MRNEHNYSLIHHNTFHLPVKTRWFIEYNNEEELLNIIRDSFFRENRSLSIGEGSNLLFINDFDGVILHSCIKGMSVIDDTPDSVLLRTGAAERWDDVVAFAVSKGWGGVENLSLIPGVVGAAVVQNVGAYGVEIKDVIETVEAYNQLTGKKHVFTNEACQFSYRQSYFKEVADYDPHVITSVHLRLQKKPQFKLDYGNLSQVLRNRKITLQTIRDTIIEVRRSKLPDPEVLSNAGSFFVNPVISQQQFHDLKNRFPTIPSFQASEGTVKIPAGWLIEQCGFKGKREGNVGVYEKQALIIVNHGGATGDEIATFAHKICSVVNDTFGIMLVPEVKVVVSD